MVLGNAVPAKRNSPNWKMTLLESLSQSDLILLDLCKAFDKVINSKLLYKLHEYGIRGCTLD
ncbi:hypothetical protein DPMN_163268 [Dreissena polymorpha]|uniref:Reverse transcriptase n=1 Tax=Dreissena polymorpha TaxID=45954 RepID=A0A9D4ET52_DREPO|nr:hypothetical protein DPMN_163268 [Dreissena polymorpha]